MSAQADAKKAELASDDWRERSSTKRSRKRSFILEWRYTGDTKWMRRRWGRWQKWSAYETARQRDNALAQKQKAETSIEFEYRAIDE